MFCYFSFNLFFILFFNSLYYPKNANWRKFSIIRGKKIRKKLQFCYINILSTLCSYLNIYEIFISLWMLLVLSTVFSSTLWLVWQNFQLVWETRWISLISKTGKNWQNLVKTGIEMILFALFTLFQLFHSVIFDKLEWFNHLKYLNILEYLKIQIAWII